MCSALANTLQQAGEFFGAGFLELPEAAPALRYARAWRRWLEQAPLPDYTGGPLYPAGPKAGAGSAGMTPSYSFTFSWDGGLFERRKTEWDESRRAAMETLKAAAEEEHRKTEPLASPHTVGGNGYTHGIVHYGRVLAEGLDAYRDRIRSGLTAATSGRERAFLEGLLDLLEGIFAWTGRLAEKVRNGPAGPERDRLLAALERVPRRPAGTFYEAMVAYNAVYYLDGCDNPGRLDRVLSPFYEKAPDRAAAVALVREFARNVSACEGWSAALGGSRPDGAPAYTVMTEIVLEATRGLFRPSLELCVRPDMPDRLWEAALDSLASGNGQPAFYNEPAYLEALADPALGVAPGHRVEWNGGGCTETMIHGRANVGSLDCGFNLPLVLVESLRRSLAAEGVTFDTVWQDYKRDLAACIREVLAALNRHFEARARHRPQPMRSLLVDDCIGRRRDFNDGGALYNWSVVNVAGLANAADALAALRRVVFEEGRVSPGRMREILARDFEGAEELRRQLAAEPKFGNDEEGVDALAAELAAFVYGEIRAFPCVRGGRFLPSHIQFETFARAGSGVGATPDGRKSGEPLADSVGPVQGRDRSGPTALLRSVARLPLGQAAGTPVLNLRFTKGTLHRPASRRALRALIESYFRMGGLQVQVTALDRAELEDALIHPGRHDGLIVRIGGYSTYFNRLSPELKREVLKRTEYAL